MKKSKIPPCQNHSLSPTVEKAAFATAPAYAPRVSTASALYCFRCGEFWSSGECWKQICFYQLFKLFPTSTCSTRLNDLTPTVEKVPPLLLRLLLRASQPPPTVRRKEQIRGIIIA